MGGGSAVGVRKEWGRKLEGLHERAIVQTDIISILPSAPSFPT